MALAATPRRAALLTRGLKSAALRPSMCRSVATQATSVSSPSLSTTTGTGTGKREGTIADAFASLSGQELKPLEPRFGALKASLIQGHEDAVAASWDRLLGELRDETARVAALGPSAVPSIEFEDMDRPGNEFSDEFRRRGVAVIRGAVQEGEARQMQDDIRAYIALNPHTKAFPADKPSVYELYWSPAQVRARAHPRLLAAQAFALSHWHSADPDAPVSSTPIAYADRLRMRPPGDAVFALGPHVDGGSCERWEPEGYGRGGVYDSVFRGHWEDLDQWEASCRLPVVASLYDGVGACSAFRMCQGWLSISDVGPFEGTLLVNPMLKLSTAYYLLRPFFSPRKLANEASSADEFLSADNWQLETSSSSGQFSSWLQGATLGQGQELREVLHPHLDLARTMVHVPRVRPGDYVLWHCDTIHAVDAVHRGAADSSVMYIPACPLTEENAHYLARQRACFLSGAPSPDFGGGAGESVHRGRPGTAEIEAVGGTAALRAMGLAPWDATRAGLGEGEKKVMLRANEILGL